MHRSNFIAGTANLHRSRPLPIVGLLLVTAGLVAAPRLLADENVGRIQVTRSQIESLPIWESILASDPRESFTIDVGSHFQDQTVTGVIELANDRRDPALIFQLAISPAGGTRFCRWREPPDLVKTSAQPSGRNISIDPTNE